MSPWEYNRVKTKKDLSKSFWTVLSEGRIQLQFYSGFCTLTNVWSLTGTPVKKVNGTQMV